jgi:hypothetical protein
MSRIRKYSSSRYTVKLWIIPCTLLHYPRGSGTFLKVNLHHFSRIKKSYRRHRTLIYDERAFLFDKLVNVLHEELPAVVHQQVQVDPLPPIE